MNLQKQPPLEDEEYRVFVASLPCCICHIDNETVVPHHSTTKGAGGGDDTCIPLCHFHHHAFHHKGRETFAKFYNVNIDELVKQTQEAWEVEHELIRD